MDSKEDILINFAYFYREILFISQFPLWKQLRLKDISFRRGQMQKAYKDIKMIRQEKNIELTLIEYICKVSFDYIYITIRDFWNIGTYASDKDLSFFIENILVANYEVENSILRWLMGDSWKYFVNDDKFFPEILRETFVRRINDRILITELSK